MLKIEVIGNRLAKIKKYKKFRNVLDTQQLQQLSLNRNAVVQGINVTFTEAYMCDSEREHVSQPPNNS